MIQWSEEKTVLERVPAIPQLWADCSCALLFPPPGDLALTPLNVFQFEGQEHGDGERNSLVLMNKSPSAGGPYFGIFVRVPCSSIIGSWVNHVSYRMLSWSLKMLCRKSLWNFHTETMQSTIMQRQFSCEQSNTYHQDFNLVIDSTAWPQQYSFPHRNLIREVCFYFTKIPLKLSISYQILASRIQQDLLNEVLSLHWFNFNVT